MSALKNRFNEKDIEAFRPAEKIGLVATIDAGGNPHISLLTSIMAIGPDKMTVGQFSVGLSKLNMRERKNIGFLVLTLDERMWRGTARWTGFADNGPEYEIYNNMPMYRYNTYFGINRVHYLDLVETTDGEKVPKGGIARGLLLTALARGGARTGIDGEILTPFGRKIFDRLDSLKFLSFINDGGFPEIIPVIQCSSADSRRLVFAPTVYGKELSAVKPGGTVAVFAQTMDMENILIRGTYNGMKRCRGIRLGSVDINWVYNSLPPAHGQIYPPVEMKPVVNF